MKRILSLACAALLLWSCLPAARAEAPLQFYDVPSDRYNPVLAQQCLSISEMCYSLFLQELYMTGLGYTKVGDWNMDRDPADTRHTVGYALFDKELEDGGRAVVIAIRGTVNAEWALNMDIAPSGDYDLPYAENFYLAAKDILDTQADYLNGLTGPKFLVTGHSRGAAVANLLSALLTDRYGSENVYGYALACPRTVRGEVPYYANIFNVINPADIVTYLPFPQWGFTRYGRDMILPVDDATDAEWQSVLKAYETRIDKLGEDITLPLSAEDARQWTEGMTVPMATVREAYTLRHALLHPGAAATGEEGITGWQLMENLISFMLHGQNTEIMQLITSVQPAQNDLTPAVDAIRLLLGSGGVVAVFSAHMPATYGAWMTLLKP